VQVGKLESVVEPGQCSTLNQYEHMQKSEFWIDLKKKRYEEQKENELAKKKIIEAR